MDLVLTDEQEILKQTAAELVSARSSFKRLRALRDTADFSGFSRDLWREMAALGWAGIALPESLGGAGLGAFDLMVVMEELGRGLMPEPMLSTVLLGANAILFGGSEAQKALLLPKVAAGDLLLALAVQEPGSRYDPAHVAASAERQGKGWRLRGRKHLVLDGHVADRIVVSARTSGETRARAGITLFLLDPQAPAVTITRQRLLDGRGAAVVDLDGVVAGEDALLGEADRGSEILQAVLDRATAGLCAEMLGSMTAAFQMTLEHLKTRTQFGVPIGCFQALKHRAAVMFVEIELARSAVMGAHRAIDERSSGASELVSVAKAHCSDAFLLVANEAIQMHGGIGMTDEHDIGFFLKRARAAEVCFGDAAYHRNRFATLRGY